MRLREAYAHLNCVREFILRRNAGQLDVPEYLAIGDRKRPARPSRQKKPHVKTAQGHRVGPRHPIGSSVCALDWKTNFCCTKFRATRIAIVIASLGLCACSTVGPASIDQGRMRYNEVIHDTGKEQTLLNIIRAAQGESPLFLDVLEVDAATTFGGTIAGGPSALGSSPNYKTPSAGTISGAVGFVTGGAQYVEAPTVRFQPLSGQPLVAQVATPLTAESLANYLNTAQAIWPISSVLTLSVAHLTPGFSDHYAALNAIIDLDEYGAITIAATSNSDKKENAHIAGLMIGSSQAPAKDSLTIYYDPKHVRISQAECDGKTPNYPNAKEITKHLWERLKSFFPTNSKSDNAITIRSTGNPAREDKSHTQSPILQTNSALGIMSSVSTAEGEADAPIMIADAAEVSSIQERQAHLVGQCKSNDFYVLKQPKNKSFKDVYVSTAIRDAVARLNLKTTDKSLITLYPEKTEISFDDAINEKYLALARRYMLIARSDERPNNAYVAVYKDGKWYSIDNDDRISKHTLALISQFNSVQAVVPQTAPLTPSISVGAR